MHISYTTSERKKTPCSLINNIKFNMASISTFTYFLVTYIVLGEIFFVTFSYATDTTTCPSGYPDKGVAVDKDDIDKMQFAVNLEFLEAEYFLWSSFGYGLDVVAPNLPMGGPPPIGAQKANLDPLTQAIVREFANQEVGHLRFIFLTNFSLLSCYISKRVLADNTKES